jgi:hypothetical protein
MALLDQRPQVRGMFRAVALDGVVERSEDVVRLDQGNLDPRLCGRLRLRYVVTVMFLLG